MIRIDMSGRRPDACGHLRPGVYDTPVRAPAPATAGR